MASTIQPVIQSRAGHYNFVIEPMGDTIQPFYPLFWSNMVPDKELVDTSDSHQIGF